MAIAETADRELRDLLDDLDELLKNPDVVALLTSRGINASLALLISEGLRAYLKGEKRAAADDLATAAEEISARLASGSAPHPGSDGN